MKSQAPTIGMYMTPSPHVIQASETISTALHMMSDLGVRHLPVIREGKLLGVVSERDLRAIRAIHSLDPDHTTVEHAMVPGPYHVGPDEPLKRVASEMAAYKIGSAIVMKHDAILGIFTTVDALRALADLLPDG
ncbi:CBS domain-containing protein [Myxococcota bacterium]|nr:CBS domain-containing protein [Myxococcota bacterium]